MGLPGRPLPSVATVICLLVAAGGFRAGAVAATSGLGEIGAPPSFLAQSRAALGAAADPPGASADSPAPLNVVLVLDYSSGRAASAAQLSMRSALVQSLGSAGHNVTLLLAAVEGVDGVKEAAVETRREFASYKVGVATLPSHKLRYSAPAHVAVSYDVYQWLAGPGAGADVVYFTDWQGLGYYSMLAKNQSLALHDQLHVTLITGPRVWHAVQPGGRSLRSPADLELAHMEATATELSDIVVAPSSEILEWLQHRGWKLPPTAVVSGWFPMAKLPWLPPAPRQTVAQYLKGGVEDDAAIELVYLGELSMRKGLPLFCSAISGLLKSSAEVPPISVTVIGEDVTMYTPRLGDKEVSGRQFLEEQQRVWQGLPGSVFRGLAFLEHQRTPGMLAYLNATQSRIAVLPAPAESGGFTMAELLLQGLPFLASNTPLARSLIAAESHEANLFTPTARALTRALQQAASARGVTVPRPSAALVASEPSWAAWHAALSAVKGRVQTLLDPVDEPLAQKGAAALFPPGVHVLASSFDAALEVAAGAEKAAQAASNGGKGFSTSAVTSVLEAAGHEGLPTVSVVLVTYNRAELLQHALASLRQQDYPAGKLEVVLVDDGSSATDALALLADLEAQDHWFSQAGWKVVRSPGGYLGNARNRGAQVAAGQWLMFMDDDNVAKPQEVSTFVAAAVSSGAEVLTCFNDYLPDGTGAPGPDTAPSGRYIPLGGSSTASVFRNAVGDANAMFKASVLRELGGWAEDDAYAVQDWELLSAATLRGFKVVVVPEALYWYRTNSGSMVRNKLYGATNSLPMRSFLRYGDPALSPAIVLASQQAQDAAILRQQVEQLREESSSQAQLLSLMAKESCKDAPSGAAPAGNRLRASEFERWTSEGLVEQWDQYEGAGYSGSPEARPGAFAVEGSQELHSINVTLSNIGQAGGAIQHNMIAQTVARPLLFQGWSRVVEMKGGSGAPADYSLYADITYQDGSHRWAFNVPLNPDTHEWQHVWAVIDPPKPIRIITIVTMFRWYEGSVLFDDLMLTDVKEGMCHIPV